MAQTSDRDANRALAERFAQVHGEYTRLRADLGELQQRLARLQVSASSPDGTVTAVVGPRGHLMKLELDPRIYREQDPVVLASRITETVRHATAEAADETAALLADYLPGDSAALNVMRNNDFGALLRRYDGEPAADRDTDDERGVPNAR
jgi:DNA-binding protein YbaB